MDVKQMIRLIIKVIGFIYWLIFLYLGGLMVVDWSGFMTRYNIETPIFLSYIVVVGQRQMCIRDRYSGGRVYCYALFGVLLEKTES